MPSAGRTPLPRLQLTILMMLQGTEPLCNTVIFPFVNQLIRETGVTHGDERKTGYYAGIIESIFFVAECLTVLFWGWASDIVGRRPILLLGPLGLTISMLSFGLSTKYTMIVLSRCAQGVFNGNVGVGKNVIAEITDQTNLAKAWSIYPAVWAAGSTLGPVIGGALAQPAIRWPETFGKVPLFRNFPYFLPCAAVAFYTVFVLIFGTLFFKETLPSLTNPRDPVSTESEALLNDSSQNSYGTNDIDNSSDSRAFSEGLELKTPPLRAVLSSRPVLVSLTTHAFLSFADQSFQVLMPLMYSTSIPLGGLGFPPARIGAIMGVWAVCNAIFQLLVFSKLVQRFGPRALFRFSFSTYLLSIGAYPVMSYLAKRAGQVDTLVYAIMMVQLVCYCFSFMAYPCNQLFIIDATPSPAALSTTNGIAQIVSSVTRSLGPSISASLFSLSLERQLAGGYMVYFVLWVVIFFSIYASSKLPQHLGGENI